MVATYATLSQFDFPIAFAVASATDMLSCDGQTDTVFEWKSVTKPLAALATLVAIDQGKVALDEEAGPPGSTVRHLLAHASGLQFEAGAPAQSPERRRVYSNLGFEALEEHVSSKVGMGFQEWTSHAVLEPLEMDSVEFYGSAAYGARGNVWDVLALGIEMLTPTLISADLGLAARTVQFPGLDGVLPGFGKQSPNDWGLGYEIRGKKKPHWTAPEACPETFGHFGQSGSFVWVDPRCQLVGAFLGAESFRASVHGTLWPALNSEVLAAHGTQE